MRPVYIDSHVQVNSDNSLRDTAYRIDNAEMDIAGVLAALMQRSGESMNQLVDLTGLTQPHLWNILNRRIKEPRIGTLKALAKHYGITVDQLRGEQPLPGIHGGTPQPQHTPLHPGQQQWLAAYGALTPSARTVLLKIAAIIGEMPVRASGQKRAQNVLLQQGEPTNGTRPQVGDPETAPAALEARTLGPIPEDADTAERRKLGRRKDDHPPPAKRHRVR